MLRGDDRGQSIQIGAILLFGVLVISLSIFQTVVVPSENSGVEFNGYVEATDDLVTLRNGLLAAGTRGGLESETVQTGVRYPSRMVLINPGPPAGSLETTASENVTIAGVEAVSGEEANVRGFWNTTDRGAQNYSTRRVSFSPGYNEVEVPPVEVSGMGAYRLTPNGPLSIAGQTFITGNRITLVTVDGDLGASGLSTSVTASPASVATRSVTVTGNGSDVTVTLPVPGNGTEAAAEQWIDSSEAQTLNDTNPNVERIVPNGSRADVVLDGSRQYELRLARVVVHDSGDSGVAAETEPQYLVPLAANGTTVPTTGTRRLAVEVRDRYNNPVEGAAVDFSATGGSLDGNSTVITGSDGRASVAFDIDDVDSATLDAAIDGAGLPPYNSTTIEVSRAGAGGGSGDAAAGTDDINPSQSGDVQLTSAQQSGDKSTARITFNNTGTANQTIEKIRISFYFGGGRGGSGKTATSATIDGSSFDIPGTTNTLSKTFPAGQESSLVIDFDGNRPEVTGSLFVMTVWFDEAGKETYFITVPL
ncbi:Ig-like domain-containing protein [Salinigranum marinum]|uniref:Ig-like domain-containing protein n=1 Tax=Salinigranum marinum TaxID=1515595 RepID=UPI002989ABEE|nr:Ig-like domain-containing protein [Salinigranum marinum]